MRLIIINRKTIYTILVILLLLLIIIFTFSVYRKTEEIFNPDVYYQGNIDKKILSFACNIDWGNEHIIPMLEIFKDYGINITFFPTGKWAEKNPDLLKEILNYSHDIGNHGYNHLDYDKLSYEDNYKEIQKSDDIIKSIVGRKIKYFAPPSGAYNDNTIRAAKELGYKTVLWSIDTIDWRPDSNEETIYRRVTEKIHNSAIVLMHPTEGTVKALPRIIDYILENGFEIKTIDSIIE